LEDPRLVAALEQYLAEAEAGRRPDRAAFLARHADIAGPLATCLDGLEAFHADRPGAPSAPAGDADEPAVAPGTVLGDFRIVREIGRGGMGVVYEAEQVSLRRPVALKVLPLAATLDPRRRQRFQNEARAAACLHHTNIVPVFAVGCEHGVHFYAMQLIEGQALSAVLRELRSKADAGAADRPGEATTDHTPPAEEAAAESTGPQAALSTEGGIHNQEHVRAVARLGVQAAEALDYAHQLGVVHRDVKPGNLMVDGRGQVWITDFGLAHLSEGGQSLTLTGDLVGTVRYMSPEQALAQRVVIDHRTDVYSLGATLYELLTLRPVFDGAGRQELLRQIAFEEPRPLRKLNRAIPTELETIVLKALEKNPADRYATAQELADDLERFQEDKPIQARRPSVVQRARKWARRHRPLVTAAAVVALLTLIGSALSTALIWQAYEGEAEQRHLAETAEANERTQRRLAEERRAAAEKSAAAERVATGQAKQAAAAATKANAQAQKRLQQIEKGTEILVSVFRDLDPRSEEKEGVSLRVLLGRRLEDAVQRLEGEAVGDVEVVARLQGWLGVSLEQLGHYQQAEVVLRKARRTLEGSQGADHPDSLAIKNHLATLYLHQGKYAQAEMLFKEALVGFTAKLGADHPATFKAKNNLAGLYEARGKYPQAEALYEEVLHALSAKLGAEHPDTLTTKSNLAWIYGYRGKYPQAEKLHKEALAGQTAKLGEDHPATLNTKNNLAELYGRRGKYQQAEDLFKEVLEVRIAKLGADHPATLNTKHSLATLYHFQGKHPRAETLLKEVLEVQTAKLGAEHPDTLSTKRDLAALYHLQRKQAEAETLYRDLLKQARQEFGADDLRTAGLMAQLGLNLLAQKKHSEAEPLLRDCLAIREKDLPDDWATFNTKSMLGEALLGQQKYAPAEFLLKEGYAGLKQRADKIPDMVRSIRLTEAAERLVQFYEAQQQPEQARAWREKLKAEKRD
jgi:serine/threonine protein kinase